MSSHLKRGDAVLRAVIDCGVGRHPMIQPWGGGQPLWPASPEWR
jgi:hypothetical protein